MKLPPPPNPTQDAQQDFIMETQQDFKELSEPCKIVPQKISFNPVVFKKIKRKLNRFIGNILARTEVYKNVVEKYDDLTGKYDDLNKNIAEKYDDLMGKYESLLAKETNIKETFWESRADNEKEALFLEHFYLTSVYVATTAGYYLTPKGAKTFIEATERFKIIEPVEETFWESRADNEKEALFLEHFYLTSVYVATTAGYYLTPKGAKTFIEATERFKIIEPVDMFMNNPTYHDVANLTYLPCPISLNKHAFNSTIQNAKKPDISLKPPRKSYFDNLFYHKFNAQKCLKAFHKYSKQYAHLKTPKEV
ncbi:glycosyltransferase family 25 protein [Helicobacter pylori]|nr:glycosyltransferase family 25 protein [Helicobacter pylori]